ncbi:MAG TPA: hypothetical protein VLH58_13140 [Candidatus Methylomirabilis sp.]|nr:hypothetical protein [Candidatus Methylomirabilis sp.]HSC72296.1 hypothetical protein [Candidatus Methylomirabilis sp.]
MRKMIRSFLCVLLLLLVIGPVFSNSVLPAEPTKAQKPVAKPTPPAEAGGASSAAAGPLQVNDTLPAPPGFVQASQCVARGGFHYVREGMSALPTILAYDEQGKLVSIEYIIPQRQSKDAVSWKGLPGVAGRSVDHINIEFYPPGPRAGGLPHYTVHLYFVSTEEQERICPDSSRQEPILRTTR